MALEYYLVQNVITPDPNDYMAITVGAGTATVEDLLDDVTREGSTVTRAEGLAFIEEFTQAAVRRLKRGETINTPLFNMGGSIVGVFNGDEDSFTDERHQVKIRMSPGTRIKEAEKEIKTKKVTPKERLPLLLHFYDNSSESQDEVATPGGGARITGNLLKFDEADATQGIFFINTATSAATRVSGKLLRNKPGELIFMIPALAAGSYRVEVRVKFLNAEALRQGTLSDALTVS